MSYRQYALLSSWSFDHFHTEIGTLSFEDCDNVDFMVLLLTDEECNEGQKSIKETLNNFLKGLFEAQGVSIMDGDMLCLCEVLNRRDVTNFNDWKNGKEINLQLSLKPILKFDKGQPVAI
ncbi:MAG: hypothetical protein WC435_03465 [Candidatus Paceibacterota bacterium]